MYPRQPRFSERRFEIQSMDPTYKTEQSLQQIVRGCIALERQCQKCFYEHFYGYAFTVCHRFVPDEEETLEVVNDGFLKIFRELVHFKPHHVTLEDSLKAWIRRIFINTSIDHLRRHKMTTIELNEATSQQAASVMPPVALERLSQKELMEMVRRLTPAYRMVFNLFVIDGYTHEEIAALLNISAGTSKSNLAKARINLQKMILKVQQLETAYGRRVI